MPTSTYSLPVIAVLVADVDIVVAVYQYLFTSCRLLLLQLLLLLLSPWSLSIIAVVALISTFVRALGADVAATAAGCRCVSILILLFAAVVVSVINSCCMFFVKERKKATATAAATATATAATTTASTASTTTATVKTTVTAREINHKATAATDKTKQSKTNKLVFGLSAIDPGTNSGGVCSGKPFVVVVAVAVCHCGCVLFRQSSC